MLDSRTNPFLIALYQITCHCALVGTARLCGEYRLRIACRIDDSIVSIVPTNVHLQSIDASSEYASTSRISSCIIEFSILSEGTKFSKYPHVAIVRWVSIVAVLSVCYWIVFNITLLGFCSEIGFVWIKVFWTLIISSRRITRRWRPQCTGSMGFRISRKND